MDEPQKSKIAPFLSLAYMGMPLSRHEPSKHRMGHEQPSTALKKYRKKRRIKRRMAKASRRRNKSR